MTRLDIFMNSVVTIKGSVFEENKEGNLFSFFTAPFMEVHESMACFVFVNWLFYTE
jgi:hypothetical protein